MFVSNVLGANIPVELVEELRKWKLNMAATGIQQDVCRAMVDVHLHSRLNRKNPAETTSNIVKSLYERYSFVTYPMHCISHGKFDHLLGYAYLFFSAVNVADTGLPTTAIFTRNCILLIFGTSVDS